MLIRRSFRNRLLLAFLSLFVIVQVSSFLIIDRVITRAARERATDDLRNAAIILKQFLLERSDLLIQGTSLFSRDYAFQQTYFADDRETIRSALLSLQQRIHADFILLLADDDDWPVRVQTPPGEDEGKPFKHPELLEESIEAGEPGSWVISRDQGLVRMVAVPLLAPEPVAWLCVGFKMDEKLVKSLERFVGFGVSLVKEVDGRLRVVTSSLGPDARNTVEMALANRSVDQKDFQIEINDELHSLHLRDDSSLLLYASLERALQPLRQLQRVFALLAFLALLVVFFLGKAVAHTVTQPVEKLVQGVRRVTAGDLTAEVAVVRDDEIGILATSFNTMARGLEEKEKVRSLLGKVVSNQIAEELLRGETVQLGGEIRTVTVLFTDLRSFTTTCEKMQPEEVLHFLNRYLDCMARVVEKHGGVIDKFIGDAIMAIFGAPVSLPDHARRAVECGREMHAELNLLNEKLRQEGRPEIAMGVGIHTGEVVAGNMGAENRLNYTVIGDTVNVAARLESETKSVGRSPLFSQATLEAAGLSAVDVESIGPLYVKGREQPILVSTLKD